MDILKIGGIPILTLDDFKWMDNIPDLMIPFQTLRDCLVDINGEMLLNLSGEPIRQSAHLRGLNKTLHGPIDWDKYSLDRSDISCRIKSVIFIPFLEFEHFGHFLTESVSWLAALLDPFLYQFIRTETKPTILLGKDAAKYREKLSAFLKIDEEQILCTASLNGLTHIETVFLPERTMINKCFITDQHFPALKKIMDIQFDLHNLSERIDPVHTKKIAGKEKIYLSRSRLPHYKRQILGETQIEKYLSVKGWQIVYPEELTIVEQIETLHRARVISGNAGSAFHLLMYFGKKLSSKCAITLGSKNEILENLGPNNVFAQLKAQQIKVYHIAGFCEPSPISKGPGVNRRCLDLEIRYKPDLVAQAIESIASAFLKSGDKPEFDNVH